MKDQRGLQGLLILNCLWMNQVWVWQKIKIRKLEQLLRGRNEKGIDVRGVLWVKVGL